MAQQEFRALFCQAFNCPPSEYEERAFRKCLYWHARLVAPLLRPLSPHFFEEDFKFIRYLGASTGLRDANVDLLNFRDLNLGRPTFWRTSLKLRVSGRKASSLVQRFFAKSRGGAVQKGQPADKRNNSVQPGRPHATGATDAKLGNPSQQ